MGNLAGSFNLGSKKVPWPCISRFATNAFQYVVEPHPVQGPRFTPARPKAGGINVAAEPPSMRNPLPSRNTSASNFPGPQLASTDFSPTSLTPNKLVTA